MGTYTQSLVDRDTATIDEARLLAECIVAWLVDEEIFIAHRPDDVRHGDPRYLPGRHYKRACGGIDAAAREEDHARFSRYAEQWVPVHARREAYCNPSGEFGPARCPHCAAERDIDAYYQASGAWCEGGDGALQCMQCARTACVTAWEHDDLLFGTLGLVFTDWPALSPGFVEELARRTGHQWTLIVGTS